MLEVPLRRGLLFSAASSCPYLFPGSCLFSSVVPPVCVCPGLFGPCFSFLAVLGISVWLSMTF